MTTFYSLLTTCLSSVHLFHELFLHIFYFFLFFFNDTATTEIYTLSLHDALPISIISGIVRLADRPVREVMTPRTEIDRSEEHTSELQSLAYLVCRLLLEKKNKDQRPLTNTTNLLDRLCN